MLNKDSAAAVLFENIFDDDFNNELTFINVCDENFETMSVFEYPKNVKNIDNTPVVFAVERKMDEDNYPWVGFSKYQYFYLFNSAGEIVAKSKSIMIEGIFMGYEEELKTLNELFDDVKADWRRLFQHRFFKKIEDFTTILFLEELWVEKSLRGLGLGKWMVGAVLQKTLNEIIYPSETESLIVGLIAYPKEEKTNFKQETQKLISFYENIFVCVEDISQLKGTKKFQFKKDVQNNKSAVLFWKAGGKR